MHCPKSNQFMKKMHFEIYGPCINIKFNNLISCIYIKIFTIQCRTPLPSGLFSQQIRQTISQRLDMGGADQKVGAREPDWLTGRHQNWRHRFCTKNMKYEIYFTFFPSLTKWDEETLVDTARFVAANEAEMSGSPTKHFTWESVNLWILCSSETLTDWF